ncbi:MAG: replicative DNA helicase [Bacilli bacterium]|nr:replicative DNA helicase [Bacilli bacterium]MDD4298689.1 replicative DNA helicase [Bacilli bacterium]MDD4643984.1 replicative DNA helicase [Bacilli bacterium]
MNERVVPHNVIAEQSVIGAAFLSKYALQKVCDELTRESFYVDAHAKIFDCISELRSDNIPVDMTTVSARLKDKKELTTIGGIDYLLSIVNSVPTAANVEYYISLVNQKSLLRKLIDTANEISTNAYDEGMDFNELIDGAERKIFSVSKMRRGGEFRNIQDVLSKTQADLEKLAAVGSDVTGLSTGFGQIDKLTSGLHETELIIIAARPGMGKTAFLLNLATSAASDKKTVAVFNLEMNAEQLATRMISSLGQIPLNKLRTGHLEHNDWKRVNEAMSQLADTNIYIDDTPGITIGEIKSKCRRLSGSPDGLDLIVIDYLQLISSSERYGGNRQQEVSDISRSLKTLALELNIPIVAAAQLSREVEKRDDKRPLMSDLRESGSIEQDADIVAFLYRDDYYNKEARTDEFNSESEFIIGKNRNGPTGVIDLLFKRNTGTFLNYKKEKKEE